MINPYVFHLCAYSAEFLKDSEWVIIFTACDQEQLFAGIYNNIMNYLFKIYFLLPHFWKQELQIDTF